MRILHTSDWHLGKRLFKLDRTPEHEAFLDWLVDLLKQKNIDVLLIAGDVFDSPTPPHQSLEMFYAFLHRVSTETKTDTFVIAGNHDSGLLLEAPSGLLHTHRVKVWGRLSQDPADHWIQVQKGEEILELCALPFFRSYEVLPQGEGDALAVLRTYLTRDRTHPQLLMLHHLAGVFEAAGSEQVISLSGVDSIPVELLRKFDYVALGHIHKPQRVGETIHYSGSPLPMRFSETHEKSVVLIEQKDARLTTQLVPVPQARAFKVLKLDEENWRRKITEVSLTSVLPPMVEVQMSLKAPVMGLIDDIKKSLEEKGLELLSYLPSFQNDGQVVKKHEKLFELSTAEVFEQFYATKYPEAPEVPEELRRDFLGLLEKVKDASQET